MTDKEQYQPCTNNFVEVSQEDLPSTANASPQIGLVQSSAIGEQSSANAMIGGKTTKKKNYLVGNSDTIFSGESRKDIIIAMQDHLAKTIPGFEPATINHLSFDD